jgi:hypothetical protein
VAPNEVALVVDVGTPPPGDGVLGKLRIRTPKRTETTRAVPAASCEEAASAMALIVTTALDPDAKLVAPASHPPRWPPASRDAVVTSALRVNCEERAPSER